MITAIDTNVLLDVFLPDPEFGAKSLETLKNCSQEGALVISEVVYTELACAFKEEKRLDDALQKSGIENPSRFLDWRPCPVTGGPPAYPG